MQHLRLLKIVNLVYAGLMIFGAVAAGVGMGIAALAAASQGSATDALMPAGAAAVLILVLGGLGVLYFATGRAVAEGRWRIVQTVLAVLNLGSFPLGTAYGAYAIWVCWFNEETRPVFERGGVDPS